MLAKNPQFRCKTWHTKADWVGKDSLRSIYYELSSHLLKVLCAWYLKQTVKISSKPFIRFVLLMPLSIKISGMISKSHLKISKRKNLTLPWACFRHPACRVICASKGWQHTLNSSLLIQLGSDFSPSLGNETGVRNRKSSLNSQKWIYLSYQKWIKLI